MDQVVRQVGQHIEIEPEWETAFNLQIKLGPCLTLLLDWCSSDVRHLPSKALDFKVSKWSIWHVWKRTTLCDKGVFLSLLSRNFDDQLSLKFSQVCYFMHMLRYTKWEDWSMTITKGVQCKRAVTAPQNLNLRSQNQICGKLLLPPKTTLLQREPFLTMFYTTKHSPLLVTK